MMSDIEGLYNKDPNRHEDARLIPLVEKIDKGVKKSAGGATTSFGTGGMRTKIKAAEIAWKDGIDTVIMSGKEPARLYDLLENRPVGTIFAASAAEEQKKM